MTSKDASLYGIQRPKHGPSQKDIASSSTLAFTSHLSSLISKDAASATPSSSSSSKSKSDGGSYTFTRGRARPSKSAKPDLFSVHNKGALKRAAKDEAAGEDYDILGSGNPRQVHQNSENIGTVDAITLQRSKRRMEEKADLYENLRKGHHLADGSSSDEDEVGDDYMSRLRRKERNALVDFDRKWAEDEEKITREEDDDDDGIGPLVDYEDEFGRARRGTRAEAAQAARLRRHTQGGTTAADDEEDPSRPARPSNLIYGETIQTHAFNPDTAIASQMAYLASKRDRSATPPESLHYDAEAEVRTRGTGFYKFSQDAKEREQEMHDLLNVRRETEREREERGQRKAERDRAKEERRAKIRELRGKRQADRFLDGLGVPV